MLIDSHCHLDFPELAGDEAGVLARARTAGVAGMLALSIYLIGVRRQRLLARRPLPGRISPRHEVYLTGASIIALILISALSLTL